VIAENREQVERHMTREDCIQALESYLRQEASYNMLIDPKLKDTMQQRLAIKAKDFGLKYNMCMSENDYSTLAQDAISRYLYNWKNKQQGIDDRGHRLGKSW